MTIEEYFGDWIKAIDKQELHKVLAILNKEYRIKAIYPKQEDVFKAFRLCSLHDCKVIMLCQDPYPQKDIATGIALGNKENTIELSPSLEVIKEAALDYTIPRSPFYRFDPTLESWEKQGILMLNTSLTVEHNKPGSHALLWRPFIIALLKYLEKNETGIIYILFGEQAKSFKMYIDSVFNYVIEEKHPAFYARIGERMPNKVFKECSRIYKALYQQQIIW